MKRPFALTLVASLLSLAATLADDLLFQDEFRGKLGAGWSWVREEPRAWRVTTNGLEFRILPGNLWGASNDARNLLVRPAPATSPGEIEVQVTVQNEPTGQYEQVGLAWYYDDSHMVKLVREVVDGKRSIVMGREQADKTRTLALIPFDAPAVQLRLLVAGNRIRGQYRAAGSEAWLEAGAGDLPVPPLGQAKIILHSYNGLPDIEHWARLTGFRISRLEKPQEPGNR